MINITGYVFVPFADNSTSHSIYIQVKLEVEIVPEMLSVLETLIIGTTLQALLTGVHLVLFVLCLRWLIFSDDGGTLRKPIHRPFLIITVILFAFSVITLGLCLRKTLLYSQDASITTFLTYTEINIFLELLGLIITDGILIFRCWTVYNRSWRIAILPLLLLLYNIAGLLVMMYWISILSDNNDEIMVAYYAATITINIYATSAITFRIWRHSLSRRFTHFAIRVIAESGLLYTLTSIAVLGTVSNLSNWFSITSAINNRTAGIAFSLILIRVAQNRVNSEPEVPAFIGDSTIERAIPAAPRHNSETVAPTREGL
ncbi:hypothetical protein F5887DRAFT_1076558 [Amanita rubescens]|nr:hypothetical protein F5887DRAFT_1076558 [Amanita rubescens]